MTSAEFARLTRLLEQQIIEAVHESVAQAAHLIAEDAKQNIIGHGLSEWPPFAASTEDDPRREGPLLREGKLRDSIKVEVTPTKATVGSDSPVAVAQEHGTSHVPPRPFLMSALMRKMPEVAKEIETKIQQAFTPKGGF